VAHHYYHFVWAYDGGGRRAGTYSISMFSDRWRLRN